MSPTGSLVLLSLAAALAADAPPSDPPPPAAPTPADADDEELPDVAPAPLTRASIKVAAPPVPRVGLGLTVGAAIPLQTLGPSLAPGLEAIVYLDEGGRFSVVLGAGFSGGEASGTAGSEDAPYTWTLALQTFSFGPALRWRALRWEEKLWPEVSVGPTIGAWAARAGGAWGGGVFPETTESEVAFGGQAAVGLAGRVGPGTLEGRATFTITRFDGALTGAALLPAIAPAIGYRVER